MALYALSSVKWIAELEIVYRFIRMIWPSFIASVRQPVINLSGSKATNYKTKPGIILKHNKSPSLACLNWVEHLIYFVYFFKIIFPYSYTTQKLQKVFKDRFFFAS